MKRSPPPLQSGKLTRWPFESSPQLGAWHTRPPHPMLTTVHSSHRATLEDTRGSGGHGKGIRCQKEEDGRKSRRENKAGKILSLITKD